MPSGPLGANEHAVAVRGDGHTRVLPRREVAQWSALLPAEKLGMIALAESLCARLGGERFTIGYDTDATPPAVLVIPRGGPDGGVGALLASEGALTTGPDRPLLWAIRPLIREADRIDIVAAFVQEGGLKLLQSTLIDALRRGAQVRLLTGDYLDITQSAALRRLLDWQSQTTAFSAADTDGDALPGSLSVRVIETAQTRRSFHPKSWRFERDDGTLAVAYVGSSNFSYAALRSGVEWNLRLERARQPAAYAEVVSAFGALWDAGRVLDAPWVADYEARAAVAAAALPPGEIEATPLDTPRPTPIQQEALAALSRSRAEGRGRALVVMATGLGKTFLAAFDVLAWESGAGRSPRVLFVAHRRELLLQAAATFRRVMPTAPFGWCVGGQAELEGQVVFASIQKLSRPAQLARLRGDAFDYVIIDEVHHAAAASYRRLLRQLAPGFLLGLTATPERADESDILRLFDDHLPYRADLAEGISRSLLVPFRYTGIADTVDYAPIPWRGGRFDLAALSEAVSTQERMERLWETWQSHPGERTLIFCVSIAHARFVCEWLVGRGVRAVAVHSGPDSADRQASIEALEDGLLDALCTVDLFNEGVDIRPVDRVVMLRPTESSVVFLQQLGRGLRTAPGKVRLEVLDFVGNHRVFLSRLRGLAAMGGDPTALQHFLSDGSALSLPGGCALELTAAARARLQALLPQGDDDEAVRVYRMLRALRGRRPRAGELVRLGIDPSALRSRHPSWLGFLAAEGDLTGAELRAIQEAGAWLSAVETARMNKSFKLVMLEVLLQNEALLTGMSLDELAARCHGTYLRSPALFRDLTDTQQLTDPRQPDPGRWRTYWRARALRDWTGGGGQTWFLAEQGELRPRLPIDPADVPLATAAVALTAELVDWRLARYRQQRTPRGRATSFCAAVRWLDTSPRLVVPPARAIRGTLIARLPDGQPWRFGFDGDGRSARPLLASEDQLGALLRGWFGPRAGDPAYRHQLRFSSAADGWWVSPIGGQPPTFRERRELPAARLADLADPRQQNYGSDGEDAVVVLPASEAPTLLAVRAVDDALDGGDEPIRRGDWLLVRPGEQPLRAVHRQPAVLASPGAPVLLRMPVRTGDRFMLHATNPGYGDLPAPSGVSVVAVVEAVVPPEALAPPEGTPILPDDLARSFGLSAAPEEPDSHIDGHRLFLVEAVDQITAPDRLRAPAPAAEETAYVLTRTAADAPWRYAGVARPVDGCADIWAFPAIDHATWRALGGTRAPQRTLPDDARAAAASIARVVARRRLALRVGGEQRLVTGRTHRGGLRLELSDAPLRSLTPEDIGWAWLARQLTEAALDVGLVARLRYLPETPPAQQRRGALAWAVALLALVDLAAGEE
ncbi:MAG: superfamily II DNA or RNA helicase/HKD family nuclease [Myxococcota bacterium]|jgi:superfamily II DNA or RNA helicase/HKD family nuclease